MPPVGFDLTTPTGKLLQTYALDRAATGTGQCCGCNGINCSGQYLKLRKKKRLENGVKFKTKSVQLRALLLRDKGRDI
jgi:hypothetical protein